MVDRTGGSCVIAQKCACAEFGFNTETSPFENTSQPSQPAFGRGLFDSTTPFGASSQSTFDAASNPGFGTSSTPPFGSSSTPAFGASGTSMFGATVSPAYRTGAAFGASNNPTFGSGGGFGASSEPVFGSSSTPGFGATGSAFGASTTSAFGGTSSTPAFGASSAPAFGVTSTPSVNSIFWNNQFGTSTPSFSAQSSPFGAQATTPTFWSSGFGQTGFAGNRGGSRVVAYSATAETASHDYLNTGQPGKLESISAMFDIKNKSHEELRWEDYQLGDKGEPVPPVSSAPTNSFAPPSNSFARPSTTGFSQFTTPPILSQSASAIGQTSFTGFTQNTAPSVFGPGTASSFVSTPSFFTSPNSSPFRNISNNQPSLSFPSPFNQSNMSNTPSVFGPGTASSFVSTPSLFTSTVGQSNSSPFRNTWNTQPSLSLPPTVSPPFGPQTTPPFNQPNMFNTPCPCFHTQPMRPSNNHQGLFNQTAPVPVTNPIETVPAMLHISIGRAGATPSVQYGIPNLPANASPLACLVMLFRDVTM
ncbi:nuclear pore complex protein NUP98A-like [Euphorbia lathyris]|uniref:nuclear pore complex protein NUP98A-like n=1 Tax=Euphorbia lathyris TaxID=212925 RepID=UPI0033139721